MCEDLDMVGDFTKFIDNNLTINHNVEKHKYSIKRKLKNMV